MNAQLEQLARDTAGCLNAEGKRQFAGRAYRLGLNAAILKLQEHAAQSACSACNDFLTRLANELRETK